jgi:hypothetical protein
MVDFPYEEHFNADYNYEAGYLAGLRAALRLLLGGGHLKELSACINEQVPICESALNDQEDD